MQFLVYKYIDFYVSVCCDVIDPLQGTTLGKIRRNSILHIILITVKTMKP
jgi:hypothetical protein